MGFGLFVFFFFKQKTAYEMRISDWSSDVCSSDLRDIDFLHLHRGPRQAIGGRWRPVAFGQAPVARMIVPHVAELRRANMQPLAKFLRQGVDRCPRDRPSLQPRPGEAQRAKDAVPRRIRLIPESSAKSREGKECGSTG